MHEVAAEDFINNELKNMARRAALEMTFGGLGRASEGNAITASAKFARLKRVEQSLHLVSIPDIPSLKFGKRDLAAVYLVKDC